MIKMIKIEGFEMWGCPFVVIFLAHDIKEAQTLFYEQYSKADSDLFQKAVDKFGYEISTTTFEVSQG